MGKKLQESNRWKLVKNELRNRIQNQTEGVFKDQLKSNATIRFEIDLNRGKKL